MGEKRGNAFFIKDDPKEKMNIPSLNSLPTGRQANSK